MKRTLSLLALLASAAAFGAQQHLDFGTSDPNDGDRAPEAFAKIEANTTELYDFVGDFETSLANLTADLSALETTVAGKQDHDTDLDAWAAKTAPTGAVVGTSDTQTLTNKSISGGQITSAVANATAAVTAGTATTAGSATTATTAGSATTAGTATALAANGANCTAGNYPLGVDASGAVESCTAVPAGGSDLEIGVDVQAWDADLDTLSAKTIPAGALVGTSDTQTLTNKSISGGQITSAVANATAATTAGSATTAGTATALGANGTNCASGEYARGVDASGAAEGCTTAATAQTIGVDVQAWDADLDTLSGKTIPAGALVGTSDTQTLTNKSISGGQITGAVANATAATTATSASTATALAANGANCSAGQAPLGVDASGAVESCFAPYIPGATDVAFADGGTGLSSAADDTTLVSSGSAWVASALADCDDTGGNHVNYDTTTNAWSCGTSGGSSFTGLLSAAQPALTWNATGAGTNQKRWVMDVDSTGQLTIKTVTDASGTGVNLFYSTRGTGTAIGQVNWGEFGASFDTKFNSTGYHIFFGPLSVQNAAPQRNLQESDAGTDLKWWQETLNGGVYDFRTRDDGLANGKSIWTVTRGATTAISALTFGNATDNPTATFLGSGITTFGGAARASTDMRVTGSAPLFMLNESGVTANTGRWQLDSDASVLRLGSIDDSNANPKYGLTMTRGATTTLATINLGNATDNPTFNFLGSGLSTFTGDQLITKATAQLEMRDTGAATDAGRWQWRTAATTITLRTINDAGSASRNAIQITRSAEAITTVALGNATDNPAYSFLGSGVATMPSGGLSTARAVVTGSSLPSNGIYLPGTNRMGFASNTTARGEFDANGVLITNSGRVEAVRAVTAAGAVTVAVTDRHVCINKTVGAATVANLPAGVTGQIFSVDDCKGDAATNNITVTPAAGNIDGAGTFVISTNYGSWTGYYTGTIWKTVAAR